MVHKYTPRDPIMVNPFWKIPHYPVTQSFAKEDEVRVN
jgi:hypothetical protein